MVKKLYKHEFAAYLRILLPIYAILLVVSAFGRIILEFESNTIVYGLLFGASCVLFVLTAFAAILVAGWYAIIRFYKNLFTGEGYLSFTLPVKPTQHLWVKSTTAAVCELLTLLAIFLSSAIFVKGPLITEIGKALGYLLGSIGKEYVTDAIIIAVELVLLMLVTIYSSYFMLYSCITIGQLAKKNRILAAIGVYFGYSVISQLFGTVLSVIIAFSSETWDSNVEVTESLTTAETLLGVEILLLIGLLIALLFAFIFFAINRHIMTKKLNLE